MKIKSVAKIVVLFISTVFLIVFFQNCNSAYHSDSVVSSSVNSQQNSVGLQVVQEVKINSFVSTQTAVTSGTAVTLTWDVSNAKTIYLMPLGVNVSNLTSYSVSPTTATTYTLLATNENGSSSVSLSIAVSSVITPTPTPTPAPTPTSLPVIASFISSGNSINAGQTITLQWSTSDATSLKLDPGAINVTGSSQIIQAPAANTTYTLTATNAKGTTTKTITVTVVAGATSGKTLEVGTGKTYSTIAAAAAVANAGDIVLVYYSATPYAAVKLTKSGTPNAKIIIRGVLSSTGQRPIISGGANTIEAAGNYTSIENFEITGGSSRCFFHHANDITLKNSLVRNCTSQGILSADDDSGSLTLDSVEVTAAGGGIYDHPVYVTSDQNKYPGSVFRIQYSYIHDNNGGNGIKSRAERNEIYYNWIESASYRALELIGPDGDVASVKPDLKREDSDVVGNVLRQTNTDSLIRIGGDKDKSDTKGRYRFVNNTMLINGARVVFLLNMGVESFEAHNNIIYSSVSGAPNIISSSGVSWVAGKQISGSNNWVKTGSSNVPSSTEWKNTITGSDPGFVNIANFDIRLSSTSLALNKGNINPVSAANYLFPNPLALPRELPPIRKSGINATRTRSNASQISIGAFEN